MQSHHQQNNIHENNVEGKAQSFFFLFFSIHQQNKISQLKYAEFLENPSKNIVYKQQLNIRKIKCRHINKIFFEYIALNTNTFPSNTNSHEMKTSIKNNHEGIKLNSRCTDSFAGTLYQEHLRVCHPLAMIEVLPNLPLSFWFFFYEVLPPLSLSFGKKIKMRFHNKCVVIGID